ncbi:TPA: DUF1642 domain-containing protein [Enterococcus faecium]|uniref:DUF1642 domain-containing protein n=1 Tax=Enterococcus TaxID=1350 RepID=UPI0003310137|nr:MULTISPECIES: DUF1642 domain-containing protein [Enterococcus]ELU9027649.1 DUF1642 domain-containing protein [Enterococcus faecalis]EOK02036.1 hypothetical protein WOK_00347 [Enterococcus faecalis EnGen0359]EOK37751.1 hypothetical protein WUI_02552 [Enterococcus faecalis EnGen0335]EOK41050.1 hypothetical protein WUG_02871 [Enterococcus faecalis EnGen0332]EOL95342.1 hypothetical protein WM1_02185 [Enterococcus faecalis EnGen0341]
MKNYYHVKTQEAYDNLMAFLETLGYSWTTGDKPTKFDIFHRLGAETVISVSEEEKRLLYTDTHTFKQGIEIDGVSLIEWPAIALKEKIEVSKEFDEWVQKAKELYNDSYKSWCIYQINKMGWGHWLEDPITDEMLFTSGGSKWTEEVHENKELHTRAILDGYTVKKEPMYEIPLSCLKTTDGEVQYLSYKDKTWFASRKNTWLKQRFTEKELKEKVPEFYRELAKEV